VSEKDRKTVMKKAGRTQERGRKHKEREGNRDTMYCVLSAFVFSRERERKIRLYFISIFS